MHLVRNLLDIPISQSRACKRSARRPCEHGFRRLPWEWARQASPIKNWFVLPMLIPRTLQGVQILLKLPAKFSVWSDWWFCVRVQKWHLLRHDQFLICLLLVSWKIAFCLHLSNLTFARHFTHWNHERAIFRRAKFSSNTLERTKLMLLDGFTKHQSQSTADHTSPFCHPLWKTEQFEACGM